MRFVVVLFIVLTIASAQAVAQSMSAKCPTKPRTIYLDSVDSTTNVELENELKKAKKLLSEGADQKDATKLRINVYSQPSWGTPGLTTVTRSVRDFAQSYLTEERLDVVAAGHREEAALEIFKISAECEARAGAAFAPNPQMSFEEVDFPDAPLGLSMFPTRSELEGLINNRANGVCEGLDYSWVSFFVVIDRDGKVMAAWTDKISNVDLGTEKCDWKKTIAIARQALFGWSFKPVEIDGVPRFIRTRLSVLVADRQLLELYNKAEKQRQLRPMNSRDRGWKTSDCPLLISPHTDNFPCKESPYHRRPQAAS